MKIYKKKEVSKVEEVLESIICNTCDSNITESHAEHYYSVTTSHSLWGNDSRESIIYLDFCTYDCLKVDMNIYFSNAEETYVYEIEKEVNEIE